VKTSSFTSKTVILKACTSYNRKVGVHSDGEKSTVSYDKNTSINNCIDKQKVANGGKFVAEAVEPLLQVFLFFFLFRSELCSTSGHISECTTITIGASSAGFSVFLFSFLFRRELSNLDDGDPAVS
jgi:hypothetical protein